MKLVNRKEALEEGLKKYFTGKPCKHGHVCERITGNAGCLECSNKIWSDRNKKAEVKERKSKHYYQFKEIYRENNKNWKSLNIDKKRELDRAERRRNKDKYSAKCAKEYAYRLQRIPPWADLNAIKLFYELSAKLTLETGIKHNVDHIIPLKGKLVSGLHVGNNLQVIEAKANFSKGNRIDLDSL